MPVGGEVIVSRTKDSYAESILELAKETGALRFGHFELSAGGSSSYYFDGRLVTLNPKGGYEIAKAILSELKECNAEAIAGPSIGADPIVAAVMVLGHIQGQHIPGILVRKEQKQHGGKRIIEGNVWPGARVAVVDDTCTSGKSLLHAIDVLESQGCTVVRVITVLDRNEGGSKEIMNRGYNFFSLLKADNLGRIVTCEDKRETT